MIWSGSSPLLVISQGLHSVCTKLSTWRSIAAKLRICHGTRKFPKETFSSNIFWRKHLSIYKTIKDRAKERCICQCSCLNTLIYSRIIVSHHITLHTRETSILQVPFLYSQRYQMPRIFFYKTDVRCKPRRYTISKLRPMDVTYFILISNY